MKGVLVTGGEQPEFRFVEHIFEEGVYICAADSGLDYCLKHGVKPDYILGDMDSLEDRSVLEDFPGELVEEHPSEKDYTDTELGLLHLKEAGCIEITLIGGGGGRLDHLIAVLALFDRPSPPELWYTAREEISYIKSMYGGKGQAGETVSLFPAGTDECRMKSRGLKWPLDALVWKKGDLGISNCLSETEFSVEMLSGSLILIRGLEKDLQNL
ncbi:MAG: thiamine diphosphokinase [Spirochaetales bacterium]|nr:thiamine diphosphokinase [Spirochaetales bacterium]